MAITTHPAVADRASFLADLDGLLNHRNAPLAVALTDLDGFAAVNDRYGRDAGDAVLVAWKRVLEANVPDGGSVARLGGDEFVVVLPKTSAENAVVLLEEVRGHFSNMTIEGVPVALSASVGIAASPPHGSTAEELWRAAGEALMRAKRDGRDRVALHVEEKMVLKSNYYSKANLERLTKLCEALDDLLYAHRDAL
jgi:diguanylate cyclase